MIAKALTGSDITSFPDSLGEPGNEADSDIWQITVTQIALDGPADCKFCSAVGHEKSRRKQLLLVSLLLAYMQVLLQKCPLQLFNWYSTQEMKAIQNNKHKNWEHCSPSSYEYYICFKPLSCSLCGLAFWELLTHHPTLYSQLWLWLDTVGWLPHAKNLLIVAFLRRDSMSVKGECCSVWEMKLICWMLPLATHCHTHLVVNILVFKQKVLH